jgi:hypothetical protein
VRYAWATAALAAALVIAGVAFLQLSASHRDAARPTYVVSEAPTGTPLSPAIASVPSVTPSAAPSGGTVAGGHLVNCAASPHVCGYPDATNTGVSRTATLLSVPRQVSSGPGWTYMTGGYVEVSGNGADLSNLDIAGGLDISASNVTVNNVDVVNTGNNFGVSLRHTSNVTIENSDIYSPYNTGPNRLQVAIKDIYGDSTGTVINANNIWNVGAGIQISEGTVENNYVHNLGYNTGDHVDGIFSDAGQAPLTIIHNTVLDQRKQTDAIALFEDFGPQFNVTITNNLIAGGDYTIYGGANPGKWTPHNIVITNNRFSSLYYPQIGYYGPITCVASGPGDIWSGNILDMTLKPILLGDGNGDTDMAR